MISTYVDLYFPLLRLGNLTLKQRKTQITYNKVALKPPVGK